MPANSITPYIAVGIWCALTVFFVVLEAATTNLVSIWFAIAGAITATIAACWMPSVKTQVIIFVCISTLTLICTRPAAKRIKKRPETNINSIVGKTAKVTETIDNCRKGEIYADGKQWSARSTNGAKIAKNTEVVVNKIEGVTYSHAL